MLKDDLNALFLQDCVSNMSNEISEELLKNFDEIILKLCENYDFSAEILGIYKKFVLMKQNAPDSMKINLFTTMRNLAKELIAEKKYPEALVLYRFLIVKADLISDDYSSIAETLAKSGIKDISTDFIKLYEKFEDNKPLLFLTVANFYNLYLKDYKSAIKYYEKYLQIDKTKSVIYTIVGNLYAKVYSDDRLDEQIFYFEQAFKLKPDDRLILHALAFSYEKLGKKDKAKYFYEKLLKNNPTPTDYYNYGAFLISCGELYDGHKYFTQRFLIDDENLKYPTDISKKWDFKSDISDKTLLVHYEQGFGDTFMYCRFVPQLKKIASKIIFVVQDSLYDLIKNSPEISDEIEIISDKEDISKIKYDKSIALLDVPYVVKISQENIPYRKGYLEVDKKKIENYAKKYLRSGTNLKVGIAYSGDKSANYFGRDIDLNKFNVLTDIKGIDFYSLQVGIDENNPKVESLGSTLQNFTDSACAIKNMDLILTTDNVILNLAGALGVKTIGIFNKPTNFRWFELKEDNVIWYESVKPIQVDYKDNWNFVFSKLVNILSEFSKK